MHAATRMHDPDCVSCVVGGGEQGVLRGDGCDTVTIFESLSLDELKNEYGGAFFSTAALSGWSLSAGDEVIRHHTVGALTIPRTGIKQV